MKSRLVYFFTFIATLVFAASETPLLNNQLNVLENETTYYISVGGEYSVTTNKVETSARILIYTTKSITLTLHDCNLMAKDGAPIVFMAQNGSLMLQFKGSNFLGSAPTNQGAYDSISAITLSPINYGRIIDVKIEAIADSTTEDSLTLYGRNFGNELAYGPIYFPPQYTYNSGDYSVVSTVTLKTGHLHLVTTDSLNPPYLVPAITATNVSLTGATVTLTNAPYNTKSLTSSNVKTWNDIISYFAETTSSPLFDCTTFAMTGGRLLTQGNRWPELTEKINEYTTNNYDTTYGYPSDLFILPGQPTGGVVAKQASTTFYGLNLASTENLTTCFKNTTSETEITSSEGVVEVPIANAEAIFTDASVDINQATAASNVFDVALMPTSKGFVLEDYDFGILKIGPSTTNTIELVVALDLPTVTADVTAKTFTLEVLCDGVSIYQDEVTLERQATTTRFMCTVTTDALFYATTTGTRKYTIQAVDE